ncbi:hypothetical protein [Leifsonia sp. AG29]|uniref:hypothetical protein n=1 Tax=Leifsonia sp. AG29 TaxID=2598860 RepID=UPI00131D0649|nr:hypothetical protein [Leifsonia sp. AG29]
MPEDWHVGTEVVVKIIEGSTSALTPENEILLVPQNGAFRVGRLNEYAIVTIEPGDAAHVEAFSPENMLRGRISTSTEDTLGITLLSDGDVTGVDGVL